MDDTPVTVPSQISRRKALTILRPGDFVELPFAPVIADRLFQEQEVALRGSRATRIPTRRPL